MRINFLTRKSGAGYSHVEQLADHFRDQGHEVATLSHHRNLSEGDVLFILGYLRIIPSDLLSLHLHNIVIHASDLPRGKGWSPLAWQISEGRNEIPFSLIEATDEVDAGDVYLQRVLILSGNELFNEWREKQWTLTAEMAKEFIESYGSLTRRPQAGEETFYPQRTRADDEVDPSKPLADSFDRIRVCDPDSYPAWFQLRNRQYRIRIEPL